VFANQSEDDIILKEELDKMEREHDNFKVATSLPLAAALTFTVPACTVLPAPKASDTI
jgi:hypothetical protein